MKNLQEMNKRNLYRFTVLIATAFLITISSFSENRTVVNDDYFEITKNLKILASIYERVNNYYVD